MNAAAWSCERSVDVDVSLSFSWQYMSNVRNWSDPPAEFRLDGPFASGSQGWTRMPGQPELPWTLLDVVPEQSYTVGGSFLEGAELISRWQFDTLSEQQTRLTQRLELRGENAGPHRDGIRAAFEPNLEPGMRRIAKLMMEAYATAADAGSPVSIPSPPAKP